MATSFHFYCPHCGAELDKGPTLWALGNDDVAFIGMGGPPPPTIHCPKCRGAIDTQQVIHGAYDTGKGSGCLIVMQVVFGAVGWLWVFSMVYKWVTGER